MVVEGWSLGGWEGWSLGGWVETMQDWGKPTERGRAGGPDRSARINRHPEITGGYPSCRPRVFTEQRSNRKKICTRVRRMGLVNCSQQNKVRPV